MGQRGGAGGTAERQPGRPSSRWRDQLLAGWRLTTRPAEAPGATLDDFFPGISWGADLVWSRRRRG